MFYKKAKWHREYLTKQIMNEWKKKKISKIIFFNGITNFVGYLMPKPST